MTAHERVCYSCAKTFEPTDSRQRYCSGPCRAEGRRYMKRLRTTKSREARELPARLADLRAATASIVAAIPRGLEP